MPPIKKVLLVDDDEAFNFLNSVVLKENINECIVTEALNGQQALDYLSTQAHCPEVILLDINMPGMDGFEFLKEFESQNRCLGYSRVFMLTSSIRDTDRVMALSHTSVAGYFDKPLSADKINKMLKSL